MGRTVAFNNRDWADLYQNLQKARRWWGVVVNLLMRMEETVRARVILYKAVVQTLLLYGRNIWLVTVSMLKVLEGFHHRVARRISGKTAQDTVEG